MHINQKKHAEIILGVIEALQQVPGKPFILKGGTSLVLCYGLDRFSEDVDLDAAALNTKPETFYHAIEKYCLKSGLEYRVKKDTDTTKRVFVDYEENRHVKVELSLRRAVVPERLVTEKNGIKVYTLSEICRQKCSAYQSRDRIRDLYDVSWICVERYEEIDQSAHDAIRTALEYKDIDQFDFVIQNDPDPLIDANLLETRFLSALEKSELMNPKSSQNKNAPLSNTLPEAKKPLAPPPLYSEIQTAKNASLKSSPSQHSEQIKGKPPLKL